jgi:hypothetical protein
MKFVAVLIEYLNIVVRVSTLGEKYPGGLLQYQRDCLSVSFCCDGLLARVGLEARSDVEVLLDRLRQKGLVLADGSSFVDIAIVDELRGLPDRCAWLDTGRRENRLTYAYASDSDPTALIAVPQGWSLRGWQARGQAEVAGEPRSQMLFLRTDGGSDLFLNRRTGQEVRVARSEAGEAPRIAN